MKKTVLIFASICMICLFLMHTFAEEGWILSATGWRWQNKDGSFVTEEIKKSNDNSYYFDSDGNMVQDYLAEINDNFYYFDDNGAMVRNTWVAIESSQVDDKPFEADAYFMYFGNNGKAIKGEDGKKRTIDGKTYIFDANGIMMVGWLNEDGEVYDIDESDDWFSKDCVYYAREDGSLAEGWVQWTEGLNETERTNFYGDEIDSENMYFYFDPRTHKKKEGTKELINGKDYNFAKDTGVMQTDWQYLDSNYNPKYTPLEWIESDGSQYIDSGIEDVNDSVKMTAQYISEGFVFYGCMHGFNPATGATKLNNNYTPYDASQPSIQSGDVFSVDFDTYSAGTYEYGDGYGGTYEAPPFIPVQSDSNPPLYIFGGESQSNGSMRLYTLQIYKNGLVRNFVPCKLNETYRNNKGEMSSAGEVGLWDTVEDVFYTREDGSAFIEGPVDQGLLDGLINMSKHRNYNRYNEYDGSMEKGKWIYKVPTAVMTTKGYEDGNYEWFYTANNGNLLIDGEKKINNKTYLFDKNGIMQTSLIVKYMPKKENISDYNTNYYIMKVDLNQTTGEDFLKEGKFYLRDKPKPYDSTVQSIIKEDNDGLYVENMIVKRYTNGTMPYAVFYFGDDGAKRIGRNIEVEFADGKYIFEGDNKGGFYGKKDDKYYSNGFLCRADDQLGLGVVIDYTKLAYAGTDDGAPEYNYDPDDPEDIPNPDLLTEYELKHLYKLRYVDPVFYSYNNLFIDDLNDEIYESFGGDMEEIRAWLDNDPDLQGAEFPFTALGLISILQGMGYNFEAYQFNKPYFWLMQQDMVSFSCMDVKPSPIVMVVDNNGKIKKKGKYKDKDGNTWLVDRDDTLVGVFSCDVKWGRYNGKDFPYYKSEFIETDSKGEQKEKTKYMPFGTKDIDGKTEVDSVVYLDSEYLINFIGGEYDRNTISGTSGVEGGGGEGGGGEGGGEGGGLTPDPGPIEPDPGPIEPDPGPIEPDPGPIEPDPGPIEPDPGTIGG